MKNLLKLKFLWSFLTLFLVLSLIVGGCGKKEKKERAKSATKQEAAQKVSEEKVIKIGAILPLTGSAAIHGQFQKQGIEIAVKEINEKGGINGHKVKIVYGDSKNEGKTGINVFKKMLDFDKVHIFYSSMSGVSYPIASYVHSNDLRNVLIMVTLVSVPGITKLSPIIYRCFITSDKESKIIGDFIRKILMAKKIGVYYVNDDYGMGAYKTLESYCNTHNIEIIWKASYNKNVKDHRNTLLKLKKSEVEALVIVGYNESFAYAIRQKYELQIDIPTVTTIGLAVRQWRELAGEEAVEGIYFTDSGFETSTTEAKKEFCERFKQTYNVQPNVISAFSYTAIKLLVEALRLSEGNFSVYSVKKALDSITHFQTPVGEITFSNQEASPKIVIKKIENGKIKEIFTNK